MRSGIGTLVRRFLVGFSINSGAQPLWIAVGEAGPPFHVQETRWRGEVGKAYRLSRGKGLIEHHRQPDYEHERIRSSASRLRRDIGYSPHEGSSELRPILGPRGTLNVGLAPKSDPYA